MTIKNIISQTSLKTNNYNKSVCVTVYELANILKLSTQRVQMLAKHGMPKHARGKYPLIACVRFYIDYLRKQLEEHASEALLQEKIRLVRARARIEEIKAKQIEENSIEIEAAKQEMLRLVNFIREELLNLPGQLAIELENKNAAQAKKILKTRLQESMNRIAAKLESVRLE